MKKFIGRLLGYEQRLGHVLAQRDENARLALERSKELKAAMGLQDKLLNDMTTMRESYWGRVSSQIGKNRAHHIRAQEAAGMLRDAHRQLNLNGGRKPAQQQILQAVRLLEGGDRSGD